MLTNQTFSKPHYFGIHIDAFEYQASNAKLHVYQLYASVLSGYQQFSVTLLYEQPCDDILRRMEKYGVVFSGTHQVNFSAKIDLDFLNNTFDLLYIPDAWLPAMRKNVGTKISFTGFLSKLQSIHANITPFNLNLITT